MKPEALEIYVAAVKLVDAALGTAHIPRPLEQAVFASMFQEGEPAEDGSSLSRVENYQKSEAWVRRVLFWE